MSELARMLKTYKIDIAFVIDATGSMGPFMDKIKADIVKIPAIIRNGFEQVGKIVESMRIKVIDFGDYGFDGSDAIHQTEFFDVETEGEKIIDAVNNIRYEKRGGDVPDNGLEALYEAMASDWVEPKPNGRQIIILVTDAPPLDLGERAGCDGYDKDRYPKTIEELEEVWSPLDLVGGEPKVKLCLPKARMLLVAPQGIIAGHTWDEVAKWFTASFYPVEPGKGAGVSIADIIENDIGYIVHSSFIRW